MSWQDLIEEEERIIVAPFTGHQPAVIIAEHASLRSWVFDRVPREVGWYRFACSNRGARVLEKAEPEAISYDLNHGYVVGDRFVSDASYKALKNETVHLLPSDDNRDHFDRVIVGRHYPGGPLIYAEPAMPLGPEDVARRFLDDGGDLLAEENVTPGLYAAFLLERDMRQVAVKARQEAMVRLERAQREEEARKFVGSAQGRRELAGIDFDAACSAALKLAGAEFLESRYLGTGVYLTADTAVRFRLPDLARRFECVVDRRTLSVIEAGVCLTNERTGEKGDTLFTLESLPSVIRQAEREGVLVVFRHV